MRTYSEIYELIEGVVSSLGFELFDLELPQGKGRTLRIFIAKPGAKLGEKGGGVNLDECARVSRRVSDVLDAELEVVGPFVLEVSSPGINRSLKRPEHFAGAVGERIRLTVRDERGKHSVRRGVLVSFDGEKLSLDDEQAKQRLDLPFSEVDNAQVEFKFPF